jgi:hypothetical protein
LPSPPWGRPPDRGRGNRPRHRISERFTKRAEQVAAVALILLGAYLIADRLLTR